MRKHLVNSVNNVPKFAKFASPSLRPQVCELELFDAFELGLLAPARMWVIEVDADASTVRFIAGDYEQETLGRLMSSSPFFKAVQVFRYSESNLKIPSIITCSSRQQAYDLWTYLKNHKPKDSPMTLL
ncbi:MAG: hypothetical protein KJP23_15625 [Deltaproteobacteria bacterium]|nr:hypothetical protein [Deltaproteobacteria bacterium]